MMLHRLARDSGGLVQYHGADARIELGGRRIFLVHYPDYGYAMACTGEWDLVCCGHSHCAGVEQVANVKGGRSWLANPGTVAALGRSGDVDPRRPRVDAIRHPQTPGRVDAWPNSSNLWRHSFFLSAGAGALCRIIDARSPNELRHKYRARAPRSRGREEIVFASNPFAEISASVPPAVMQAYVVLMIVLVAAGTLFDVVHKGSARYFFENWRKSKGKGAKPLGGGELVSIAVKTGVVDVLTSGEFCNPRRRIAHLLGMYGFVIYVVTTAILIFGYPTTATPAPGILPLLWWIGGLMICVGGYWFWFFIRVDVAAEGHSPFRLVRADLFILSLLASATLGLIWAFLQSKGSAGAGVFFGLYILATTVLFAGVPWSKFAHMFFKPAAAFEKRVSEANGTVENLPTQTRDDPEQRQRHSMELLRDAPLNMGLGIKREAPRHY